MAAAASSSSLAVAAQLEAAIEAGDKGNLQAALGVLGSLTRDRDRDRAVADGAGAGLVRVLAQWRNDAEVVCDAYAAIKQLGRSVVCQLRLVRDAGVQVAVMAAARAHSGNAVVARKAIGALDGLAAHAENGATLVREGAHFAAAAAIRVYGSDSLTATYVCSMLQGLAGRGNYATPLVRDGAHLTLVAALTAHTAELSVTMEGCIALHYLAAVQGTLVTLVDAGAHTAVLAAVRANPDSLALAQDVCAMLQCLAATTPNLVPLIHAGVYPALLALQERHEGDGNLASIATGLLLNLVASISEATTAQRTAAGYAAVIEILQQSVALATAGATLARMARPARPIGVQDLAFAHAAERAASAISRECSDNAEIMAQMRALTDKLLRMRAL